MVSQQFMVRNRGYDLFDMLKTYPELLGIAIEEDTALVLNKNDAEVLLVPTLPSVTVTSDQEKESESKNLT